MYFLLVIRNIRRLFPNIFVSGRTIFIFLINEGLFIKITSVNSKGASVEQPYLLSSFNNPYLFQPVFTLSQPVRIPFDLWMNSIYQNEYPLQVAIELFGSVDRFSFDVMIVYDEG